MVGETVAPPSPVTKSEENDQRVLLARTKLNRENYRSPRPGKFLIVTHRYLNNMSILYVMDV